MSGISAFLKENYITGLLGKNVAGKSTLIKIILGWFLYSFNL
ncbi:ATP-binding cassette domain-containing protein [Xylanivirga thermophila]